MMKRFTHFLIYALLFLLPWQTHLILKSIALNGQAWEYGMLSLFVVDILIILAVIGHTYSHTSFDLSLKRIPYRYALIAFLIYLLALISSSLSPWLSITKTIYLLVAVLLVYMLTREPIPFKSTALAFVLGAVSSGLLGIWQFVSQSSFASSWFGLAVHDPSMLGTAVVEAIAPDGIVERWLRAYGSLDHPNMFGGFMALALIFATWLWLNRDNDQTKVRSVVAIFSTIILSAALIVSFSRGAWLAAAIGLAIVVIHFYLKNRTKHFEVSALIGSIMLVTALIASQYGYLFLPRLAADSRLENISIVERSAGIRDSLQLISQRPWLGSGAGTYALALSEHIPNKANWFYQPVHNIFALIATEIGVVGLLLFLASLTAFIMLIYKKRKSDSSSLIIAVVCAVFIIALFDHWLYSLHFGIICSGALIGLLANASRAETLTE